MWDVCVESFIVNCIILYLLWQPKYGHWALLKLSQMLKEIVKILREK